MPGLVRKLLIFAAVDGLVLQPLAQRGQRLAPAAKVAYSDKTIGPVLKDGGEGEGAGKGFEAFGIVGLVTVSKSSFLISIIRRQQVAQIQGRPIYVITEVALTPLVSRAEAELSITRTQSALQKATGDIHGLDDSDSEGDEGEFSAAASDEVDDDDLRPVAVESAVSSHNGHKTTSTIAEDVITRKGGYGRFAQKWFSKKGWTADQRRNLGMSVSETGNGASSLVKETGGKKSDVPKPPLVTDELKAQDIRDQKVNDIAANLLPKLLRTTKILFGSSRSFFFSYDYDITRSFANRRTTNSELPLYTEVDPLFFWNRKVIKPFIDAGQTSLVLPLMQGFVGQRSFTMDTDPPRPVVGSDEGERFSMEMTTMSPSSGSKGRDERSTLNADANDTDLASDRKSGEIANTEKSFLLTLISRRSVKRAGLRYLRRGVDEEGNTANGVETEQILSDPFWSPSSKLYSFVQIRGSIPIFFSQPPYSFKPVPQIQHSGETNFKAFKRHFENLSARYGALQVASLVEKHGNEAIVGDEYEKMMGQLNESGGVDCALIGFEWFDFHAVCRGMKFENVSLLMESLGRKLDSFGDTVELDGEQLSKQRGVLRTNCMDCLDRTNVVQSACGRRALEQQLKSEGIDLSSQTDQTTQWFNTLWADNGDSISKQYASTAALKGDFTRTRKRDYKGALTDMGLSISRFYSGIVNDYFSQAAIDFLVGNVTSLVFEDFEANLMSGDPGVSMQKVRQHAIEESQKLVVADENEEFIGGWTLLTPQTPNTIKSMPFEESVLLLTDAALYACRFDWNMEKVLSFERIDLKHILSIKYGSYITSTLSPAQADEKRNVGLVVVYKAGTNDATRVNTRSMSTVKAPDHALPVAGRPATPPVSGLASLIGRQSPPTHRVLALKALPSRSAVTDGNDAAEISEIELVKTICSEIDRIVLLGQVLEAGVGRKSLVEKGDIISLSEAKKSTGLLEHLGYSLKKMVWA